MRPLYCLSLLLSGVRSISYRPRSRAAQRMDGLDQQEQRQRRRLHQQPIQRGAHVDGVLGAVHLGYAARQSEEYGQEKGTET